MHAIGVAAATPDFLLFRLSWKWRDRSSVKITERPREKATQELYRRRKGRAILRRHFLEKIPISDLCEEHGLHPTMFYRW